MDIVTITGGGYTAGINLSRGANCIRLRNERYGASLLREPDYEKELDNPYLYGMPILFPVNRISGGSFEFDGRVYRFPVNEPQTGCHLHGELHAAEFALSEQSESRVVAVYRADREHPYLSFPHEFEIRIEYTLDGNGLTHTTAVTNCSTTAMPCLLGFHTTFNIFFTKKSRKKSVRALVDFSEEFERNMQNYLPTGRMPTPDEVSTALRDGTFDPLGTPISRHYRAKGAHTMSLTDTSQHLAVVYENDASLPFRLIYNGNADEYICLEPQTSLANSPNAPFPRDTAGFLVLAPGERKIFSSKIYLKEI